MGRAIYLPMHKPRGGKASMNGYLEDEIMLKRQELVERETGLGQEQKKDDFRIG